MDPLTDEQMQSLEIKKKSHDYAATAYHILSTRVQFYAEEFEGVHQTLQFLKNLRDQIKLDIEKIEPPKQAEAAKPYVIDAGTVSAKKVAE